MRLAKIVETIIIITKKIFGILILIADESVGIVAEAVVVEVVVVGEVAVGLLTSVLSVEEALIGVVMGTVLVGTVSVGNVSVGGKVDGSAVALEGFFNGRKISRINCVRILSSYRF